MADGFRYGVQFVEPDPAAGGCAQPHLPALRRAADVRPVRPAARRRARRVAEADRTAAWPSGAASSAIRYRLPIIVNSGVTEDTAQFSATEDLSRSAVAALFDHELPKNTAGRLPDRVAARRGPRHGPRPPHAAGGLRRADLLPDRAGVQRLRGPGANDPAQPGEPAGSRAASGGAEAGPQADRGADGRGDLRGRPDRHPADRAAERASSQSTTGTTRILRDIAQQGSHRSDRRRCRPKSSESSTPPWRTGMRRPTGWCC